VFHLYFSAMGIRFQSLENGCDRFFQTLERKKNRSVRPQAAMGKKSAVETEMEFIQTGLMETRADSPRLSLLGGLL